MARGKITPLIEPNLPYRRELYKIYVSVFESNLSANKKEGIINSLFSWEAWSWRVVGISFDALRVIKSQNFPANPKGIVRGHKFDRAKTHQLFLTKLFKFDEWWQMYWGNDETEIVTREENKTHKKSEVIWIDCNNGYFSCNPKIGFKFRKTIEGERCRILWDEYEGRLNGAKVL
jgi:hypothetical protein